MKNCKIFLSLIVLLISVSCRSEQPVRILFWNIQNGMWAEQGENYDKFVNWVTLQNADICVWAEAQSNYKTGSKERLSDGERYLVENLPEFAARYGHAYTYVGGHRDNFPQAITSKYPIKNIERIVGEEPDSVVTHGCGWAQVEINKKVLNLVSVHTWPQRYAFRAQDTEASKSRNEGDFYRKMEVEYILNHTVRKDENANDNYWIMMGDLNSISRLDNELKYNLPVDTTAFIVQDYILENSPYIDIIKEKHPNEFKPTTLSQRRIDYIYCTQKAYDSIIWCDVIWDEYTSPVRDSLTRFCIPSDHLPIIVDLAL